MHTLKTLAVVDPITMIRDIEIAREARDEALVRLNLAYDRHEESFDAVDPDADPDDFEPAVRALESLHGRLVRAAESASDRLTLFLCVAIGRLVDGQSLHDLPEMFTAFSVRVGTCRCVVTAVELSDGHNASLNMMPVEEELIWA